MDTPRITLAIYGNQYSNGGFQPLYWINQPTQQLENLIPPGMGQNPYFFIVETGARFTHFTLVENNVSSCDGHRSGVLKIAIGIPHGYRLANDESPLTVLMDIRKTFIAQCMTQKSALSLIRNFKEELPDNLTFMNILNKYCLIPSYEKVVIMQGSTDAIMLLSPTETADFFRNVHFPELAACRKLIVGEQGNRDNYTMAFSDLAIPRPFVPSPTNSQQVFVPHSSQTPLSDVKPSKKPFPIIPIVKYGIVPLLAFMLGFVSVFIVSLIIH